MIVVNSARILSFVSSLSLLFAPGYATPQGPSLRVASQCTCLGHTLTLECTTVGPGITVWTGSAFNCTGNTILLRHSQFMSPQGVNGTCNNGIIVGYSLRVTADNCFTSQLNITVSSGLIGSTVQCTHNNGQMLNTIGLHRIDITTDSYPPPSDIQVIDIRPGQFTFNWRPVHANCSAIHYNIIANHCGIRCPSTTIYDTITCTGWTIGSISPCVFSFALRTVVCDDVNGNMSDPVLIVLKELQAPVLFGIPVYSATTGKLESISTFFNQVDPFTITDGIEGFAVSYTITYTDAVHGKICDTATILASSCISRSCSHTFELSTSSCHPYADISITVFGTSQLGNGSLSEPVTVGAINNFVKVMFDFLASRLQCTLLNQPIINNISCNIAYSPEQQCLLNTNLESELSSWGNSSSVTIEPLNFPHSQNNMYCYTITASNGTYTVKVKGVFNAGCDPQHLTDGTPLSGDITCGAPYLSLRIKNGIVCYNGVDTGATALYICSSPISTFNSGPSVRTCMSNGTWNGSVPQCDHGNDFPSRTDESRELNVTVIASITILGIISSVLICIFILVTIILAKAKNKIEQELMQTKANALYEEIPQQIDSTKNIAYISTNVNN